MASGRTLTLRPRSKHEALVAARQQQQTADFKACDALRAGIAISVNLVRLVAWFAEPTHSQTQTSRFVALAPA